MMVGSVIVKVQQQRLFERRVVKVPSVVKRLLARHIATIASPLPKIRIIVLL
jgi:hypothetical protein